MNEITTMDFTIIFEAFFALMTAVVSAVVIPYINSRTTAQQREEINAWVRIAVAAAEQLYKGAGQGEKKKEYVMDWLRSRGIAVDEKRLDALIESAVYDINSGILTLGAAHE